MYRGFGKRLMDVLGASALAILTLPIQVFLAMLIRKRLGAPVVFEQERPGLNGNAFTMYKFRTMTDKRGSDGLPLPDDQRLTSFGVRLRSTSLDELPELYNVIKGDMSLVGPRPLLMRYLPRYTARQALRHSVRPGLTGWSQVNGRNANSWEDKLEQDVWYVHHVSFRLDVQIMWSTISAVLRRHGIQADGHATAPEFLGSDTPRT